MALTCVTITGADDQIDPVEMARISSEAPFIEWAILFSSDRVGTSRYPTREWRKEFYKVAPDVRRAAHLCGKGMLGHFSTGGFDIQHEIREFQRIQLNFNVQELDPEILSGLVNQWKGSTWKYKDGSGIEFITQYNEANASVHNVFSGHWIGKHFNHSVLFDGSGGTGKTPGKWPSPLQGIDCGYAGGLGPENLEFELPKIIQASSKYPTNQKIRGLVYRPFWIDMESKVRTNEQLDMKKVQEVIRIVRSFNIWQ